MQKEITNYKKQKERLEKEFKNKRMKEVKSMQSTRNFRKQFETSISKKILEEDRKNKELENKKKELIRK